MRPRAAAPPSLTTIAARVDGRLRDLLDAEAARWRAVDPALVEPLEALRHLVDAGGKRLRPAFCYWGFVAAGGDPDDPQVVDVGAAFEMLHAFALVHDDVMDGSPTRRGAPTTHLAFADAHRAAGWRGEDRRFGEGAAILVGDMAHVYADVLLGDAPADAWAVWHELRLELDVGQYLDLLGTARADRDRDAARRIARYKSGKYTIERPLHVGAALAGRLGDLAGPLSAYGDPLGEAFQLRDDVLGAFGDPARTGKPVGQDLREGKPTPLLAAAAERAAASPTGGAPRPCWTGSASPISPTPTWRRCSRCWSTPGRSPRSRPSSTSSPVGRSTPSRRPRSPPRPATSWSSSPATWPPATPDRLPAEPGAGRQAGRKTDRARCRDRVRTPGSAATAASHGGRTTAVTTSAVSRPDSVAAWRA